MFSEATASYLRLNNYIKITSRPWKKLELQVVVWTRSTTPPPPWAIGQTSFLVPDQNLVSIGIRNSYQN